MKSLILFSIASTTFILSSLQGAEFKGLVLPFREVTVSSPVEARLEVLHAREGDVVKKGETLIDLYAELQKLEAKRAEATVEMRAFEYKSSKNLFDDNVISEDEALESRMEWDLAELTLEMTEEQVSIRAIEAPISGIVVERFKEEGEMVQTTEPILTLVNLDQVFVQIYVPAEVLKSISLGQETMVTFPSLGLEEPIRGGIEFIDPRVDAASGLLRVRILLDNPEGIIKAGVRAHVSLSID